MNAPIFTQENLLFTITTPLGDNKLLFKSLQGEEQLSNLFHFQLEMLSESKRLNFDDIVGQPLTLTIQFAPDHTRYFHGLVTHFVQADTDARFTVYHAQVRPWLYLLILTKNCRIFQNLTVPEIIKKVFDDLGFTDYRFALSYQFHYEKRVYCVQYEETAFNFVSRLMEDEGIFYFFEHHEDKHVLVLADDLVIHEPCPGIPTARFLTITNDTQPENAITECYFQQQMTTDLYTIDDFNFEIPTTQLRSSIQSLRSSVQGKGNDLRIYEYAAGFSKKPQGEDKVKLRIQGQECQLKQLEGQGHCLSFASGYRFQLTNHPRDDFNQEYVLRWVSHSLSLTHYSNTFTAFPVEVVFRPPIITPKPKMVSTQTAIVTGPKGEEIWTDQYGRVKIQFHWDQEGQADENSSCWIRVNQSWAGRGYGNLCIPRIGQEVIVSFLNGNPDEPLVTGAVYNAQQTVPNSLPTGQNKSTMKSNTTPGGGGSNEMSMDDTKGKEKVYVHAQKDLEQVVENNMSTTVKVNQTLTVNSNRTKEVKVDQKETVGANKTISVGADHKESISANKTLSVGANHKETIGANMELTVGGTKTETITGATTITINGAYGLTVNSAIKEEINGTKTEAVSSNKIETIGGDKTEDITGTCKTTAPTVVIDAGKEITLQVGGNSIKIDSSGITINGVKITSSASGVNEITGSTVKLN